MHRKQFLQSMIMTTTSLKGLMDLPNRPEHPKMPVLFVGHGSPMNGIEDNDFSRGWREMGAALPVPAAVLVVSAHWLTKGTQITAMDFPRTIHDFGGFPDELYQVRYPAPGSPALAKETISLVKSVQIHEDHEWGLDHGSWTVVRHMFPNANIPVLQLSIDYTQPMQWHYNLAKDLSVLRDKGVLIIGSGNMVHNLRLVDWARLNERNHAFDWAKEANAKFHKAIAERDHRFFINYREQGSEVALAVPTPDHFIPLIYTLGMAGAQEEQMLFNDEAVGGSLTMTSLKIG